MGANPRNPCLFFLCGFPPGGCYRLNMTPDSELLGRYARTRSEDAFAELVRRHVNLVYSAALRQVNGDAHLAQDVAQTVFTDLARKAASLARRQSLTGWLYTSAHFAASKIARREDRRRYRDDKYMREPSNESAEVGRVTPCAPDWEQVRPTLDDVMHELKESDREAILLRYFENRPFAEVGAQFGVNENAARMRVERAVEKLRAAFAKRGIAATTTLAAVISANAVQMAPAGLAATLTTTSFAAVGTGTTFTLLKLMTATQMKLSIGALVVAGAATVMVVEHQTQTRLRDEGESLRQQIAQLETENQNLSHRLAAIGEANSLTEEQMNELLKLRADVTRLRENIDLLQSARTKTTKFDEKSKEISRGAINFSNTPISMILEFYAALANATVDAGDGITNSVYGITFTNTNDLTRSEAVQIFEQVLLDQAGIQAIHSGNLVIFKLNAASPLSLRRFAAAPVSFLQSVRNPHIAGELNPPNLIRFFKQNGIEIVPPESVYWEYNRNQLMIRAPEEKLDAIEQILQRIHSTQ